jgi:hypothetical protein
LLQPASDGWHFIHLTSGPVKAALYKPWNGADSSQVFTDFDQRSEVDEKTKRSQAIKWKLDSIGWDFIPALLADESLASEQITSIRIVTTVCNTANICEVIEAEYPRQEFFMDSVVIQETAPRVKALADALRKKRRCLTPESKWQDESPQRRGRKYAAANQLLYTARTSYRTLLEPEPMAQKAPMQPPTGSPLPGRLYWKPQTTTACSKNSAKSFIN